MARKPEQLVWDRLRSAAGNRILFQRHEDKLSAGIPDLSGVSHGIQFWCELKAEGRGGKICLRQSQLNWMLRRSQFGILCVLLVGHADRTWSACAIDYNTHWFLTESPHVDVVSQHGSTGGDVMQILDSLVLGHKDRAARNV